MRKPAQDARTSPRQRARTLAGGLAVLVAGTALYAPNVRAETAPQHPRDSRGISTLALTAARAMSLAGETIATGSEAGAVSMAIAWTSPWGSRPQRQPIR